MPPVSSNTAGADRIDGDGARSTICEVARVYRFRNGPERVLSCVEVKYVSSLIIQSTVHSN